MKVIKTQKGYFYKEYKNGKKVRISKENYLKLQKRKKSSRKIIKKQKGGIYFDNINQSEINEIKNQFGDTLGLNYSKYVRKHDNYIYYYSKNKRQFINLLTDDFYFVQYLIQEKIDIDEFIQLDESNYEERLKTLLKLFNFSQTNSEILGKFTLRQFININPNDYNKRLKFMINQSKTRQENKINLVTEFIKNFPNDSIRQILNEHPFYIQFMEPILRTKGQKVTRDKTTLSYSNIKNNNLRPQYLLDLLYGTQGHIIIPDTVYMWWISISSGNANSLKQSQDYVFIPKNIEKILEILINNAYNIELCIVYNVINHILRIITNYYMYSNTNISRNQSKNTSVIEGQVNYRKQAYDKFKLVLDMAQELFTNRTYFYYTRFVLQILRWYKSRMFLSRRYKNNRGINIKKVTDNDYSKSMEYMKYLEDYIEESKTSRYFIYALTIAPNENSYLNTYCLPIMPFACSNLSTHEYYNEIVYYHPIQHIYHDLMFHMYSVQW